MIIRERVSIRAKSEQVDVILKILEQLGLRGDLATPTLIHVSFEHFPAIHVGIRTALEHIGSIKIYRSIAPVYDDADYDRAELFRISYPDLSVADIPSIEQTCSTCGQSTPSKTLPTTSYVNTSAPIVYVNNEFTIISSEFSDRMSEAGLTGLKTVAFDDDSRYHHLRAQSSIGELVVNHEEFLGYRGTCDVCGSHLYDMHFGPQRYRRSAWNGDDFVWTSLRGGDVLVSRRALEVVQSVASGVTIDDLVFLD